MSAFCTASISRAWSMGVSSRLSSVSKSSRMRVSMASGSLRVTITSGRFAAILRGFLVIGWRRLSLLTRWQPQGKYKGRIWAVYVAGVWDVALERRYRFVTSGRHRGAGRRVRSGIISRAAGELADSGGGLRLVGLGRTNETPG